MWLSCVRSTSRSWDYNIANIIFSCNISIIINVFKNDIHQTTRLAQSFSLGRKMNHLNKISLGPAARFTILPNGMFYNFKNIKKRKKKINKQKRHNCCCLHNIVHTSSKRYLTISHLLVQFVWGYTENVCSLTSKVFFYIFL